MSARAEILARVRAAHAAARRRTCRTPGSSGRTVLYGGTERIVSYLTEALVEHGHDVTLFASADSVTKATHVPVPDSPPVDPSFKSDLAAPLSMLHRGLRKRRGEFDVLHVHGDLLHFPFFEELAAQTVTTLHGRLDLKDLPEAYARWRDYPLVSISDDQRTPLPEANWLATIPHGLAESIYTFNAAPGQPPTSPSSAGSHRRNARTAPSPSPSARACR